MLPVISLTLLQACGINSRHQEQADTSKHKRVITVTSSPAGATVRADGNKLGKTPLEVNLEKSFSRKWVSAEDYGIVYRRRGVLTIEKSGCTDYTVPVSETDPSDDLSITLACTEEKQTTRTSEPVKIAAPENVKQRLKKLEELYKDGAISTDEYNQHRSRILGEL